MKALRTIYLYYLLGQTIGIPVFSQEINYQDSININIESGALKKALQTLSDCTGIRFAYRHSLVISKQTKHIQGKLPFEKILNKLITENKLYYSFQHNQIIIHKSCFPDYYRISGMIVHDSSYKPIPYVALSLSGNPVGTFTDHNGYFELKIPWTQNGFDKLVVSSMGYERDTVLVKTGVDKVLTIKLKKKFYAVKPVLISPKEYESTIIGNTKNNSVGSLYLDTHGQQTALRIENDKQENGILSSVKYYLSDEGKTDAPFRVRIYSIDTNGLPGNDLVKDAVVVKPESGEGWFTVYLEDLNIVVPPEGLYVAIEGVFPDDYNHYYGGSEFIDLRKQNNKKTSPSSLTYGQRIGYNRKCRKDTWHYSISRVWFQLEKQSFGVMIAAVVKYEKENNKEKDIHND